MNSGDMSHLVPNPDDVLKLSTPDQGRLILRLLTLADHPTNDLTGPTKSQRISYNNFFNRANDFAARPKYAGKQRAVDEALMEAWAWLAGQGFLAKDPGPGPDWYFVTKSGRALLTASNPPDSTDFSAASAPDWTVPSPTMSGKEPSPPDVLGGTVFISYTWDNQSHQAWVLTFANRLRTDGINARVDQLHLRLGDRSPQFMEASVRDSEYVLVICTEAYKQKFDARRGGAGYEGHIITAEMVTEKGQGKFIPVLRQGTWETAVPTALTGIFGVDFRSNSEAEYTKLVAHLKGTVEKSPSSPEHTAADDIPDLREYWQQRRLLGSTPLFTRIQQRPRWCIWVRPAEFRRARFRNLDQSANFMRRFAALGKWRYPAFLEDRLERGDDWVACENEDNGKHHLYLERWVLFRSAQFVQNLALDEQAQLGDRTHVLEILDRVTAAYECAAAMAHEGVLSGRAVLTFSFDNVDGRQLTWPKDAIGDENHVDSKTWSEHRQFEILRVANAEQLASNGRELALDTALEIYAAFRWSDVPKASLKAEQMRRFGNISF